jgi:hypothetical protein
MAGTLTRDHRSKGEWFPGSCIDRAKPPIRYSVRAAAVTKKVQEQRPPGAGGRQISLDFHVGEAAPDGARAVACSTQPLLTYPAASALMFTHSPSATRQGEVEREGQLLRVRLDRDHGFQSIVIINSRPS